MLYKIDVECVSRLNALFSPSGRQRQRQSQNNNNRDSRDNRDNQDNQDNKDLNNNNLAKVEEEQQWRLKLTTVDTRAQIENNQKKIYIYTAGRGDWMENGVGRGVGGARSRELGAGTEQQGIKKRNQENITCTSKRAHFQKTNSET